MLSIRFIYSLWCRVEQSDGHINVSCTMQEIGMYMVKYAKQIKKHIIPICCRDRTEWTGPSLENSNYRNLYYSNTAFFEKNNRTIIECYSKLEAYPEIDNNLHCVHKAT